MIMTIQETVTKIKSGELSAEKLVLEHLELARTTGKELNAFTTVIDDALAQAKEIDRKVAAGEEVGKLAGIPCTVKDVIMTEGVRTTAGSQYLKDFIAPYSATVVRKIQNEGAIIIGKTNCDPFAFGGSGENSGYGPALNPRDLARVPGGSSSGAAAAQAAGIGLFGLGTDTGGSVREPASFTGTVGFKPTYGRNSRFGLIAMASSFDTPGIFADSVEDVAYVEQILAGKDPLDATTYDRPVPDYANSQAIKLKGLKVGLPKEYFEEGLDPEVEQAVRAKVDDLKQAGAEIKEISLPLISKGIAAYYVLVPAEISSNMARFDGVRFGPKVSDNYVENMMQGRGRFFEDEVKRRIMIGTYVLSAGYADAYYKTATKVRAKLTQQVTKAFAGVDVILGPTAPCVAPKIGEKSADPLSMYLMDSYTVTANLTGCPAISINCGENKDGMPIGLQLMTDRFAEDKLFAIARAVEKL
ncbi:Asp-tRNA(Asn)/Glu-tRNA(Gln) amidotransferase subunit GatA [Candidatus Dojkabacteria bacterium]|uniref:Glutamyl-tRNA(Gln) amidotransferase subunit A n=1 Tax=Candidatus Dojkabacteria bacterium TaxID=2099670 RepID=A0A955I802_9BACT|nr:Asp-tRNA(Asn)/Glu-tRNA(Gln) amidotransferase subunit GatA [Candidatus Dojkabacteria bacterium]